MMHLVPSCSPLSTFDVSQLEFDLDLLPSLCAVSGPGQDCVVPSASPHRSPPYTSGYTDQATMFSPGTAKPRPASPGSSLSPTSPYSPAARGQRRESTQSSHSVSSSLQESVDMSSINLQESLLEFTALQDRIKQEQELLLDCGPPYPGYPPHRCSVSSEPGAVFPLSPDTSTGLASSQPDQPVKCEPAEFPAAATAAAGSANALLKQCLSDTSFQTKYNLKPANFGITTGFVSDTASSAALGKSAVKVEVPDTAHAQQPAHPPLKATLSDSIKMEPLLDLAADQVSKEIASTCEVLSISPSKLDKKYLLLMLKINCMAEITKVNVRQRVITSHKHAEKLSYP